MKPGRFRSILISCTICIVFISIFVALFPLRFGRPALVTSKPPFWWKTASALDGGFDASQLKLAHNRPEVIRAELLNTNTIFLIAKWARLTETDLATVQVVKAPNRPWVELYQLGRSEKAFKVLSERLRSYVVARQQGHTKEWLVGGLTNKTLGSSSADPDLRALATRYPLVPFSLLTKSSSGTITNQAGHVASHTVSTAVVNGRWQTNETKHIPKVDEVCRWVAFTTVDGEIGWKYSIRYKADGSLDYIHESRCDGKELDPKYRALMRGVDDQCHAEMKRDGTLGTFGSVHSFWHLKKEALKAKGVEWRSPAELNPHSSYD